MRDLLTEWTDIQDGYIVIAPDTDASIDGTEFITLSEDPGVGDDTLIGIDLTITSSTVDDGTYTIVGNIGTVIEIDTTLTGTQTVTVTFDDDEALFDASQLLIDYLNTSVPSTYINYEIQTYNDYYKLLSKVTERYTTYLNFYIDETIPYDSMEDTNIFLLLEPNDYTSSTTLINNYKTALINNTDEINTIFAEFEAFMERMRELSTDFNISEERITDNDWQAYYDTRDLQYQTRIDTLYNAFVSGGRQGFVAEYQNQYTLIKITR